MAETLVESMSDDFDPEQYTDEYQIELRKVLDEAIANGSDTLVSRPEPEKEQVDAEVVDLVAALQRSLDAAGEEVKPAPKKKAPARRKRA